MFRLYALSITVFQKVGLKMNKIIIRQDYTDKQLSSKSLRDLNP